MDLDQRLHELHEMWPDLTWDKAILEKCDHDVIILDDAWVFRFPCNDPHHEPLEPEVRFLESIRDRLDIPVPHYTRVDPAFRAAGYPMLPGEPLTMDAWDRLSPNQHQDAATQLAEVLNTIHTFPLDEAKALGMGQGKRMSKATRSKWLRKTHGLQAGGLTQEEMKFCERKFRTLKLGKRREVIPYCIIHGDFDPSHLLHDGTSVSGIIDFGDGGIGDPAIDLLHIWKFGERFFDEVFAHYGGATESLKRRSCRLWFLGVAGLLNWAVWKKSQKDWERAYRVFPPDVADPSRQDGSWLNG